MILAPPLCLFGWSQPIHTLFQKLQQLFEIGQSARCVYESWFVNGVDIWQPHIYKAITSSVHAGQWARKSEQFLWKMLKSLIKALVCVFSHTNFGCTVCSAHNSLYLTNSVFFVWAHSKCACMWILCMWMSVRVFGHEIIVYRVMIA